MYVRLSHFRKLPNLMIKGNYFNDFDKSTTIACLFTCVWSLGLLRGLRQHVQCVEASTAAHQVNLILFSTPNSEWLVYCEAQ